MKEYYEKQHRLAKLDPYHSIDRLFEADQNKYLVGIKNTSGIPNTLMHKLEAHGFALHTIDGKSRLAGRAVDIDRINPITGHYMSGSSSGTAINVFAGINDLGIGTDGGGSVLAPAICVNIYGFISQMIEKEREQNHKPNTDGIVAGTSIGFMSRDRSILYKAIEDSTGLHEENGDSVIFSDREYPCIDSKVIQLLNSDAPRNELTVFLREILSKCDVLISQEGPIDIEGFGDSLFGHFDERTKEIQKRSGKGYVRVCNIAGATALAIPSDSLGTATLLMCENDKKKISHLLHVSAMFPEIHDELITRYFLNLDNYFLDGYQV